METTRRSFLKWIAAGAAAMLFSMPLGAPMTGGGLDGWLMDWMPWLYALPVAELRWGLLAVTAGLALWAGLPIYRSAWKSRHRSGELPAVSGRPRLFSLLGSAAERASGSVRRD